MHFIHYLSDCNFLSKNVFPAKIIIIVINNNQYKNNYFSYKDYLKFVIGCSVLQNHTL